MKAINILGRFAHSGQLDFNEYKECIDAINEIIDFEDRKCTNCKHYDEAIERLIHCSYFEQYMPIEIGKCDKWEGKDK